MVDCYSTAREMVGAIAQRDISARELLDLQLARIAAVNPEVNAIVSLDEDRARESAVVADQMTASGAKLGPLHGLPFAFKDTHAVAGWLTTYGSPLMRDNVPKRDDLIVERIRAAGAIPIGKTNVPEWAAGSHTFNPIFGTTYNPYDLSRSAGGSSGGAAAALASGMLALADGSDMGGSLRNPASFNNVVGLRPSAARVPSWPSDLGAISMSVSGPMARTVDDVALLLSVIAGPDSRTPYAFAESGAAFATVDPIDLAGLRVAMSTDLGGQFEVDDEVAAIIRAQTEVFEHGGAEVDDAEPNLRAADDVFRTLRAWEFDAAFAAMLARNPDGFKKSLADNIRAGEGLTGADIARAFAKRTALGERMRVFFEEYDVLAMPVSQVPPFSADLEFPTQINGHDQESYLDWMRSAYLMTTTGCPAISVPAGFTADGLPVGVQLVGPAGGERRLLQIARAFEQATQIGVRRPELS